MEFEIGRGYISKSIREAFNREHVENFPCVFKGEATELFTHAGVIHEGEGKVSHRLPSSLTETVGFLMLGGSEIHEDTCVHASGTKFFTVELGSSVGVDVV